MFDMEEYKNKIDPLLGYFLNLGKGVKSTLSMDKQVDIPTLSIKPSEKQKKEHKKILDESLISIGGEIADSKYLALDGAAMCSYVYANNKLRAKGTVYETHSKNWNVFSDITILGNNDRDDISDRKYSEAGMGIGLGILRDRDKNSTQLFNILKERLIQERTGFGSALFYKKNKKKVDSIAYVLEGSGPMSSLDNQLSEQEIEKRGFWKSPLQDRIGDWGLANLLQGLTGLSPQHTLAVQNAKILHQICLLKGIDNLYFFGHSLGGGLAIACALATNKIRTFELVQGGLTIMNLPISYIFLKQGCTPQVTLYVSLFISLLILVIRTIVLNKLTGLSIIKYFRAVAGMFIVAALSFIFPFIVKLFSSDGSIVSFLLVGGSSCISFIICVWNLGLSKAERYKIGASIKSRINKRR